jgi:hypothetical protein
MELRDLVQAWPSFYGAQGWVVICQRQVYNDKKDKGQGLELR